ncbi:MAG TPA: aspartate dehydrogenase [Candidatus Nitrosocosmicus sp.]|nr:aspartate dehydrogenase [Candidatus Nitrosocosmicus sp.]
MKKEIALIGCGAIGNELAQSIDNNFIPNCSLSIIFDIDYNKLKYISEKLKNKPTRFNNFLEFINSTQFEKIDLVIEAASINAASNYVIDVLKKGKNMLIMSIGVFSDHKFNKEIIEILERNSNDVFLPSGAIGGIDIIRSIKNHIESITLTTTKNNKALKGAPFFKNNNIDIDKINMKKVIFEGNAYDAIQQFPSNVNVSALVSLAGIGFKRTNVKIVVDPDELNNTHELNIKWKFGDVLIKISNKPSLDNPKTSYLATLSALECLRSIYTHDLKIGS